MSEALTASLGESRVEWCWLAGVPRHVVIAERAVYGGLGAMAFVLPSRVYG